MLLVSRNGRHALESILDSASRCLLVCAPYITAAEMDRAIERLRRKPLFGQFDVHLITDLRPDSILFGSLDMHALLALFQSGCRVKMTALPNLHAKVYVADQHTAWVTSANLTTSALDRNFEYGVLFDETSAVATVHADLLAYATVGAEVSYQQITGYASAINDLQADYKRQRRAADQQFRRDFREKLETVSIEAIRLQVGSRSPYAVFGDAIAYVLRSGPLKTSELYPLIQSLLPDLCDDRYNRVIDGRRFGKLWKHHVRTAQQHLKRAGIVIYEQGRWKLTSVDVA